MQRHYFKSLELFIITIVIRTGLNTSNSNITDKFPLKIYFTKWNYQPPKTRHHLSYQYQLLILLNPFVSKQNKFKGVTPTPHLNYPQ